MFCKCFSGVFISSFVIWPESRALCCQFAKAARPSLTSMGRSTLTSTPWSGSSRCFCLSMRKQINCFSLGIVLGLLVFIRVLAVVAVAGHMEVIVNIAFFV